MLNNIKHMKKILNELTSKHRDEYNTNDIEKWKKIIQELLEIQPHEIQNIYELKQSTKIAFLFFKWKKYFFSVDDFKKILRLNEFWIKESEKLKDYKLKSHFYWHAWYIAQQLFRSTFNKEYADKALKYSNKALEKYENDITYQIQINNNIINLWDFFLKQTIKDKKLVKKWIKITLKKIEEQFEIYQNYPNTISSKKLNELKIYKNFLEDRLNKLVNKSNS